MKYCGIGGQAVMEGIMMKNGDDYAVAVRKADGEIVIKKDKSKNFSDNHPWAKWPFVRGVFSFIDTFVLGINTLMWSASQVEVEEEKSKEEKEKEKKKEGSGLSGGELFTTVLFAVVMTVGLFILLPAWVSKLFERWVDSDALLALMEGILRLLIFVAYVAAISLMKDIQRVFMYHGSEHKCINCIEHGLELNVENVLKSSKEHKRCGTSFLLIVMVISIVLFIFIRVDGFLPRILSRILLIPVVAGISYELLRLMGRYDNAFINILVKPGLWLQGLTTREPDAEMAEVAIKAVEAVFDWKKFEDETFGSGCDLK